MVSKKKHRHLPWPCATLSVTPHASYRNRCASAAQPSGSQDSADHVVRGTQCGCAYAVAQAIDSHPLTVSLNFVPSIFCGECGSWGDIDIMTSPLGDVAMQRSTMNSWLGENFSGLFSFDRVVAKFLLCYQISEIAWGRYLDECSQHTWLVPRRLESG